MKEINKMDARQMDAALQAALDGVTPEQLTAIQCFVRQIGGLDNAQQALRMLRQLDAESGGPCDEGGEADFPAEDWGRPEGDVA